MRTLAGDHLHYSLQYWQKGRWLNKWSLFANCTDLSSLLDVHLFPNSTAQFAHGILDILSWCRGAVVSFGIRLTQVELSGEGTIKSHLGGCSCEY